MANIEVARANFIDSLTRQFPFAVATDMGGLNGNTREVVKLLEKVRSQLSTPMMGVETIAWLLRPLPFPMPSSLGIAGYHSLLGTMWGWPIDMLVTGVSDRIIYSPDHIFQAIKNMQTPAYVVLHCIAAREILKKPFHTRRTDVFLAIENTGDAGTDKEASEQVKNREQTIRVFDIVHYFKDHGELFTITDQKWNTMCDALARCGPCIVHLPIGRQPHDSLNLDPKHGGITENMWYTLAQTLQKNKTFVTIEYQPQNMLLGNSSKDEKEIAHIVSLMKLLQSYAVLQFHSTS